MDYILYTFCVKCDRCGIVPAEKEIDAYLKSIDSIELRTHFIKFCFYHWENRYKKLKIKK